MLKLDHLTIIAPSLAMGADYARDRLGIDMPVGGRHPQMGTHNLLLRLGSEIFLEVIALDPLAEPPSQPRWFGLDDIDAVQTAWDSGFRLRGWVAQTKNIDDIILKNGFLLGQKQSISRGDRRWLFTVPHDGSLPADGIAPSVIDWGERGNPAPAMPDFGAHLLSFQIEHPEPDHVKNIYDRLEIADRPNIVRGQRLRYSAVTSTPSGNKELF